MKYFSMSILNTDELYNSADRIARIVNDANMEDAFVGSVLPLLQEQVGDLGIALGKDSGSAFTETLAKKDEARDSVFVGLRDFCKAFTSSLDAAKAEAAQLLVDIFQERGWSIYRMGYSTQSSQMNVLISDLEQTAAQNALTTIGAQAWFADLKTAQQDFENTYQQKISTESAQDFPKISETRKNIAHYLQALLSYIEIQSEISGDGFAALVEKIDEVTTDTLTIARARRTRSENGEETEPVVTEG